MMSLKFYMPEQFICEINLSDLLKERLEADESNITLLPNAPQSCGSLNFYFRVFSPPIKFNYLFPQLGGESLELIEDLSDF